MNTLDPQRSGELGREADKALDTEAGGVHDPGRAQREAVRRGIAQFQARLQAAGHDFREPPPEPTSCCGRGCHGCVWESYDAALMWWYEDGGALLAGGH